MGIGPGRARFSRAVVMALVTGTLLVVGLAACTSPSASSGPNPLDKVTAEVVPIVDVAPIYLGKKKGFFAEENIDLTLDTAAGGANIIPAVAAGQYEFGFSNSPSVLIA